MNDTLNIVNRIREIPKDTAPAALPELLKPILKTISTLDAPTQNAILYHEIKNYFELTNNEIKAYEKHLKTLITESEHVDEDGIEKEPLSIIPGLLYWTRNKEGIIKYLTYIDDKMEIKETEVVKGKTYRPKQDFSFLLPGEDIIYKNIINDNAALLKEVEKFIRSYVELPNESGYLILALWVFHTYLVEKAKATPLMYFWGQTECGKSRAGEVLTQIAYKCELTTSPTEACLFREADWYQTALILDEIKLLGEGANKPVETLLKSRYNRLARVGRCNTEKKGEAQVEKFSVFAPVVLCSTERVDNIVGNRTIKFVMKQNVNPEVTKDIDEAWAKELREKLLFFRKEFMYQDVPFGGFPAERRLGQITRPLYQMLTLTDPTRKPEFDEFVKILKHKRKDEESETHEAELLKCIFDFIQEKQAFPFTSKDISGKLNIQLTANGDKFRHTPMAIGKKIEKIGFEVVRTHSARTWAMPEGDLRRLAAHYDLTYPDINTAEQSKPATAIKDTTEIPF
jgi:hypothetical protein